MSKVDDDSSSDEEEFFDADEGDAIQALAAIDAFDPSWEPEPLPEDLLEIRLSFLTDEEREAFATLRAQVDEEVTEEREVRFCDSHTLLRYLRARKYDVKKAKTMLLNTLAWRKEANVDAITAETLCEETQTGKQYCRGFDRFGRPVTMLRAHLENTFDPPGQINMVIYHLEKSRRLMNCKESRRVRQQCKAALLAKAEALDPQEREKAVEEIEEEYKDPLVEGVVWIIDQSQFSFKTSPPFKVAKATVDLLSNHYPECLGRAFLFDAPKAFSGFWMLISPILDKVTANKIVFCGSDDMSPIQSEFTDLSQLETQFGGTSTYEFNWEVCWAKEIEEDKERRRQLGLSDDGEAELADNQGASSSSASTSST